MKELGVLLLPSRGDAITSQDTQHEATRSITTPPGWSACPSQGTQHEATGSITIPQDGMLVHRRVPSMKQLGAFTSTPPLPPRPGWDASPSQGFPNGHQDPVISLGKGGIK